MKKVSIIIPTYQHLRDCLQPCCESIVENTVFDGKYDLEVLVVANGCTDGTQDYIKGLGAPFRLIDNPEPLGYPKAVNMGLREAKGDFLILLNNDTIILDPKERGNWLDILIEPFIKIPRCGLSGPIMSFSPEAQTPFLVFFCVAISRWAFERIGFLDESFSPGGCEDIDYCARATKNNVNFVEVSKRNGNDGDKKVVGDFPIFHEAEKTVGEIEGWKEIFDRNTEIIRGRYSGGKGEPKKAEDSDKSVTCVISTRGRYYTTLPLVIMAVCNQTAKPKHLIVFDDGEHKDLRSDPVYSHLFQIISASGISWQVEFSGGCGQVLNHIASVGMAKTTWIWRLDDDNVPKPDVLEKLLFHVKENVGAVGGAVIDAKSVKRPHALASNSIGDIFLGLNEQWFDYPKGTPAKEVDHLYSTFIYRRDIAEYPDNLSPIGFREETILTYEMKQRGYVNIFEPNAVTWHFCNPEGGIRDKGHDEKKGEYIVNDERVFASHLVKWGVRPTEYAFAVLKNGLGDHLAFKSVLPLFREKNKGKKIVLFVSIPEAFYDVTDVTLASIADAESLLGDQVIERMNVYGFIARNRGFDKGLPWAFKNVYGLNGEPERGRFGTDEVISGTGDTIVISPYSFYPSHPKSYPYWKELVALIRGIPGKKIIQIGISGEERIEGVDEHLLNLPLKKIEDLISKSRCWIGVDNFLQHLVNTMSKIIKGAVIFGVSDPNMFGYRYNKCILKSRRYLRPDQHDVWTGVKQDKEVFDSSEIVFDKIKEMLI
ncbi:MAG: glycosyltransferase [Nitrospirae bacterium]|nr:glycosyltransferase [Nitrospirota bacterium]